MRKAPENGPNEPCLLLEGTTEKPASHCVGEKVSNSSAKNLAAHNSIGNSSIKKATNDKSRVVYKEMGERVVWCGVAWCGGETGRVCEGNPKP